MRETSSACRSTARSLALLGSRRVRHGLIFTALLGAATIAHAGDVAVAPIAWAKLAASDAVRDDRLGSSVAISGDIAVAGATWDDTQRGAAYVFERQGASWVQTAKLVASDGLARESFGWSVAALGDTIVVSAIDDDDYLGAVYVFEKSGSSWVQSAKLVADHPERFGNFGYGLAITGSTLAVGALGESSAAVYVFERSGTSWLQTAKLLGSDEAEFAHSVSLDGDVLVVGARLDNQTGAAYVYERSGTDWVQTARLEADDGASKDFFGRSVAVRGDVIAVGADGKDSYRGAAYTFERSGASWIQTAELLADDGADSDVFGYALASRGDVLLIGAYGVNSLRGSAYVFEKSGATWVQATKLVESGGAPSELFGQAVAMDGDRLLIGAQFDDDFRGAAYVFSVEDLDGDGVSNALDNCPKLANADQANRDGDGAGDVCDDCTDADQDGYGQPLSLGCPRVWEDCDDTDASVHPGAIETPGDGIDQDCNPLTPIGCSPELAEARSVATVGPSGGTARVPTDLGLYLVPAAVVVLAMRSARRRTSSPRGRAS